MKELNRMECVHERMLLCGTLPAQWSLKVAPLV
jgi:hypothetical protein